VPRHAVCCPLHLTTNRTLKVSRFAYAELYLTIATIFRRFEFELYDTVHERDVEVERDFFLGSPGPKSRGVRVRIVKERI